MNNVILDNPFEMDLRELEYKRKKNNEEEIKNLLNGMEQYLKELVENTKEIKWIINKQ